MKLLKALLIFVVVAGLLASAVFFGGKAVMKTLYPLKYIDIIEECSQKYAVDKALILAVIKSESNFDENAVSSIGAMGLMQITPSTFDWLKSKTGDDLPEEKLFDSSVSIEYGTYLLKILLEELGGQTWTAVAAYHAGIGTVGDWVKDSNYSSDGKTLDYIPYDDTRLYVENVKTAKNIYEKLYDM